MSGPDTPPPKSLPSAPQPYPVAPIHPNRLEVGPVKRTVFAWYELKLVAAGAGAGTSAANAERVFFSPTLDATVPIAEGPPPADWVGYHAGKHGVYERFSNLKGESVTLGELFFNEKYRWVQAQYLTNPNQLKGFTVAEFQTMLDRAYQNAPRQTEDLSGIFDSPKFTQDVKTLFDRFKADPHSTVWQARYIYKDFKTGEVKGLGDLQTNVDFEFQGSKYRVAVDAKTGKALNFFRIETNPKFGPMKFAEIVLKWKGKVTDVTVHTQPGATVAIEISATWTGIFRQGVKSGAIAGGLVGAFFGAIDGFKKEGLVGALKGFAIGGAIGLGVGGLLGGVSALLSRIWPILGKVFKIGGFIITVLSILLDPTETGRDPQEWAQWSKDKDGNKWGYRHIIKQGTFLFPEYVPHGVRIECTDGTVVEFGDDEAGAESTYVTTTPIRTYANTKRLRWHMTRTPEGSSMWWWQDLATMEEFAVCYDSDATMLAELARFQDESAYRFAMTQN